MTDCELYSGMRSEGLEKDLARHYLRAWRKHRGLTQAQLAERMGISRPYLTKVERGDRRYDQTILETAAEALGCTAGDLISRLPDDQDEIRAIWASLTESDQSRALAVLRAMFPRLG